MNGVSFTQSSQTKFIKRLAVQDLEYLREAIKHTHPFPFAYTNEPQFNAVVDKEIWQLQDTVSYYDLRNSIRRIVYYIHCVHSNVMSRRISKKEALLNSDKFFPLEIRWLKDDFYVFNNYSNDSLIKPGSRILSINGISVNEIVDSIKTYRSGDGPEDDFIRGWVNLPFQFNFLYDLHFPEDSCYEVQYLDSLGRKITTIVQSIYEPITNSTGSDTSTYLYKSRGGNIHLKQIKQQVFLLRIDNFNGFQSNNFRKVFQIISNKKCNKLILDLRTNYGGGMDNANELLSYIIDSSASFSLLTPVQTKEFNYYNIEGMLKRMAGTMYFMVLDKSTYSIEKGIWKWQTIIEPKLKYNYDGQLIILINEHTLSAASYLASQLKHRTGAFLIGAPSGGGEFGNAGYTYTSITLPNSESKIKVPRNWINYDLPFTINHELYPNEVVYPTIEDLLDGRDVVMDKAINIMEGNPK